MNFLPLTSILVAGILINLCIRRSDRIDNEKRRRYFERERRASLTPSKNLDKIKWIKIPEDLPIDILDDDSRAARLSGVIHKLSSKKIANLGDYTNTELKLEYGAVNIDELSRADSNCIVLLRNLSELSTIYIDNGLKKEAAALIRFAVESGSEDPEHFRFLEDYYLDNGAKEELVQLCKYAEEIDSERVEKIAEKLRSDILLMETVEYD